MAVEKARESAEQFCDHQFASSKLRVWLSAALDMQEALRHVTAKFPSRSILDDFVDADVVRLYLPFCDW